MNEKLENALFEARPYLEYYEDVEKLVRDIWDKAADEGEFLTLLEEEIKKASEPFKTDLRILLQKFGEL
jgi:hypothetical protein